MKMFKMLLVALMLCASAVVSGQVVKGKELKDTVIKSVTCKMYVGSRGGRYVLKTSKSGNVYKLYFK